MQNRSGSAVSQAREGSASGLRARIDLSLVAAAASPTRAHNKSTIDDPALQELSGAARARALRLAQRLASSHSG